MQLRLGKGLKCGTETFATLARCPCETFETAMIGSQEGHDPVGFSVVGVVQDDSG